MADYRSSGKSIRDRLAQWDSLLAPLNNERREEFMELSSIAGQRPLPTNLPNDSEIIPVIIEERERDSLAEVEDKLKCINTTEELFSWFDEMDSLSLYDKDRAYRDYANHLEQYSEQCKEMVHGLTMSLDALSDMGEKHKLVSEKTQALYDACEQLVQEQNQLSHVAEGIISRLSYFTELEQLGQKLNAPSFSTSSDYFPVLLTRLDDCIAFIETHSHYKESSTYLARYKQQLSKALASIKQQFVHTLKSTTQSVIQQQQQSKVLPEASYSQYYGKFRAVAPKLKSLMNEVESRAKKSTEYNTLLHDCLQCYITQRKLLMSPSVSATLVDLTKQQQHSEHGVTVRSACNLVSRVCLDEFQLYHHFFSQPSDHLNDLIESICYQMYDSLRPIVIHINHLETLTELCAILKVEIIEEVVEPKGEELTRFGLIIKGLLSDIQQRLVFRAQRYIQNDIRGYKPALGDLSYPEKLIVLAEAQAAAAAVTGSSLHETFSDTDSVFDMSGTDSEATTPTDLNSTFPLTGTHSRTSSKKKYGRGHAITDLHAMWYPTVRRTLMFLSKLYRCLERKVFEGLAQEAVSECVSSLHVAASGIQSRKGDMNSELFLIKHLLILREQIAAFNVSFSVKEVYLDFSKTKAAAFNLLRKRSRLFSLGGNNAFLEFIFEGFPELIETQLDSKKEVDLHLKQSCELFIMHATASLVNPLKTLVGKFDVVIELAGKEKREIATFIGCQPFAEPKEIHTVVSQTNKILKTQVPLIKQSLSLYLSNEDTEKILFKPIMANVLNVYQSIENYAVKYYNEEDQQIISCLSSQEVTLLLSALPAPIVSLSVNNTSTS